MLSFQLRVLRLSRLANVDRQLNVAERHQLAYLFAKSYVVSKVKYGQDYYINPDAPISRLMLANFSDFKDTQKEGGIWLRDLFNFFRSQTLYKSDVERSMRGLSTKQRARLMRERHHTTDRSRTQPYD